MTHKHKCSNGHVWEHGTTQSKGLTNEEWTRANTAAHTCGVCGEVVYQRFWEPEDVDEQIREVSRAGMNNAKELFDALRDLNPDMEPAELLATVYYFGRTAVEWYADFQAARGSGLFGRKTQHFDAASFWKDTFGEKFPNPFTKEGVQHG